MKLFRRFKKTSCLVDETLFNSLKFKICLGHYFKFSCVEIAMSSTKILQAEKIEELSEEISSNLMLLVRINLKRLDKLQKLKKLFLEFAGDCSVFFVFFNMSINSVTEKLKLLVLYYRNKTPIVDHHQTVSMHQTRYNHKKT